ncbi:hypothetical protein [Shewanella waksmanii]|uniref:hypothetical protein n=1 Tax=Shewanella waksmanii TaxID=213783 RepID=UPI0004B11F53|nr:hypothetical protein [Shewanella waksmanii]
MNNALGRFATVLVCFLGLTVFSAQAQEGKQLQQNYSYHGQAVVLDIEVGRVEVIATDESEVRVEVEVVASQSSWFNMWQQGDVSEIEIDADEQNDRLVLKLNHQDDLKQNWRVYLPRDAATDVDIGIGEVEVAGLENDLAIDLGVGRVVVNNQHRYRDIELSSGVGEVQVRHNGEKVKVDQALVSQSYEQSSATGQYQLLVSVGVGQVEVSY